MDRDRGGESGRRAQTGRDILSLSLSRLEPRVPIHFHYLDLPRLTACYMVQNDLLVDVVFREEDEFEEEEEKEEDKPSVSVSILDVSVLVTSSVQMEQ